MGYSLRTRAFRYTEWRAWDRARLRGRWDLAPHAVELYEHSDAGDDPFASETANVAADPSFAAALQALQAELRRTFAGA